MNGLFITSNNTNSGKTFITTHIIRAFNEYYNVRVYKPIETACPCIEGKFYPRDAQLLNAANNNAQDISEVCPYPFAIEASGEIASKASGVTLDDIINKLPAGFPIVEGAGGFFSPLVAGKLNAHLAEQLALPVVIVIEDTLGAISEALLTIAAVHAYGLNIFAVVLNQKQSNTLQNARELMRYTKERIITFTTEGEFSREIKKWATVKEL